VVNRLCAWTGAYSSSLRTTPVTETLSPAPTLTDPKASLTLPAGTLSGTLSEGDPRGALSDPRGALSDARGALSDPPDSGQTTATVACVKRAGFAFCSDVLRIEELPCPVYCSVHKLQGQVCARWGGPCLSLSLSLSLSFSVCLCRCRCRCRCRSLSSSLSLSVEFCVSCMSRIACLC
jgi:hypothetical protein